MKILSKILSILENKRFFCIIISLWIIVQIIYMCNYWAVPQSSDGTAYMRLAQECIDLNVWYPDMHNISDGYLFAPGYVNLLIATHKIFGAFAYVVILNFVFNIVLLVSLFSLAKKIFSENIARISVILFCCTFSNFTSPIAILGDLPYTSLVMLSIALMSKDKLIPIVLAGVCIALSNWIRPLSVIFVFTSVVYMFANKYAIQKYVVYFVSIILTTLAIGLPVKERIGAFMTSSNTSGVNLAANANKYATGMVAFRHSEDEFYADFYKMKFDKPVVEADNKLRNFAIAWIMENPYDYIKLFPRKLFFLYSLDNWSIRSQAGKGFGTLLNDPNNSNIDKFKILAFASFQSSFYYIVLLLFLVYLWQIRKDIFNKKNILLLIPFLGTAATIIFIITDRHHYPYMPIITIYAGYAFAKLVEDKKQIIDTSK